MSSDTLSQVVSSDPRTTAMAPIDVNASPKEQNKALMDLLIRPSRDPKKLMWLLEYCVHRREVGSLLMLYHRFRRMLEDFSHSDIIRIVNVYNTILDSDIGDVALSWMIASFHSIADIKRILDFFPNSASRILSRLLAANEWNDIALTQLFLKLDEMYALKVDSLELLSLYLNKTLYSENVLKVNIGIFDTNPDGLLTFTGRFNSCTLDKSCEVVQEMFCKIHACVSDSNSKNYIGVLYNMIVVSGYKVPCRAIKEFCELEEQHPISIIFKIKYYIMLVHCGLPINHVISNVFAYILTRAGMDDPRITIGLRFSISNCITYSNGYEEMFINIIWKVLDNLRYVNYKFYERFYTLVSSFPARYDTDKKDLLEVLKCKRSHR